jgi:hypothetical protein
LPLPISGRPIHSSPNEAPLVVLATKPVDEAEQAMLAAARAFLEG